MPFLELVKREIPSEGTSLEHPLTLEFIWLDQTYTRYGDLFSSSMMGVFLFNLWHDAERLEQEWISYREVLRECLTKAIFAAKGKTFPQFTYNIRLDELLFTQGRVWNPNGGYSLYCSSRADLEERLELANTDGREILAFTADGEFYVGDEDARQHLTRIGEEIGYPFDDYLKRHPYKLMEFTRNRIRKTYRSHGESDAEESIAYPELLGTKISVHYAEVLTPHLVQVRTEKDGKTILLDYRLQEQSLNVVRGAMCMGLSEIVKSEVRELTSLQIDAFTRGFSREVMVYTTYIESQEIESRGRLGCYLTSAQILDLVRHAQPILEENLHNPRYRHGGGHIPHRRE